MQTFILFIFAYLASFAVAQQGDVCSQVHLMNQYCSSQGSNETGQVATYKVIEERMNVKFQEMEARLRRTLGEPPEINYTMVEETISQRFKGVESRVIAKLGSPPEVNYTAIDLQIDERFRRLEARVNGDGNEPAIVDYEKIQLSIDARFRQIQAFVEAKFASLLNNTEDYENAVEEMNRRKNITDCREVRMEDAKLCNATGGVFDIYRGNKKFEVFCDTYTDNGGWTVFQRRMDGSENFNRTWDEYVEGFGDRSREFWLGLKNIHALVQSGTHELRIDILDAQGRVRFARYGIFYVAGKTTNFNLMIQGYTGDLGNYLTSGIRFSTLDSGSSCTRSQLGGWWAQHCHYGNLNGVYGQPSQMFWYGGWQNLVRTEMKFRKLIEDE